MAGEMTPKKRHHACLTGGKADRRSAIVLSNFVVPLMEATGVDWPDCQLKAEALAKLQAGRYEVCGLDSLLSHNDLASEVSTVAGNDVLDIGTKDRHISVTKHVWAGKDPDDCVAPEDATSRGRNPIISGALDILSENYGDTVAITRVLTGPMTVAGHLWGVEPILELSKTNPDKATQALEIVTDLLIDLARDAIDNHGADSIYVPDPTASGDLLSPASFNSLMVPIYKEFTKAIKDVPTYLHICGNTAPFLMYAPDTGFDAFSYEAPGCYTIDAKRKIGDRMALIGSLETVRVMMLGSPELVYKETLEHIRDGADVICPACGTPPYTPLENIKAMVEATKPKEKKKKKRRPKVDIVADFLPEDAKLKELTEIVMEGDDKTAEKITLKLLDEGYEALDIVEKALLPGAIAVAKLYDGGYVFVPEILLASGAMQAGISHCKEAMSGIEKKGKIIMHVADGDVHEIGKNIVATILEAKGYEIVDLGKSVAPTKVLDAIKAEKPDVVSGTSLMTSTRGAFPKIAQMMKEAGFSQPFVVAGGSVDTAFAESMDFAIYADGPEVGDTVLKAAKGGKSWKDIREEVHSSY
ncbi:MAG TPA: MtaA/CmuA family methyltransferase [Candidatus Methanofastidiosa archaeon]|nr:MtaA/CmuA family methyltransferase [Candidatus Methanofastidiosa archaeon]